MRVESPPSTWLLLPSSFAEELPETGPVGLRLQPDGCCNGSPWVEVEVFCIGHVFLTCGWQSFVRAHDLDGRRTLHLKYDGAATLFIRVFGKDGSRLGCCLEGDDDGSDHSTDDDGQRGGVLHGELALDNVRCSSSSRTSSGEGSSDDDYDEPPRRRARTKEDGMPPRRPILAPEDAEPPRHQAPIKEEEHSN